MANHWHLKCDICNKAMSFMDAKDIHYSKWTILAWDVESNTPLITCPKCVYPINIIKKQKAYYSGDND